MVNTGAYSVARIEPGESFITEPVILPVPQAAPYKVRVEAVIENTYYQYSKPEQVTAPGIIQSVETTISETAYRAFATPEKDFYTTPQPVVISGEAIDNYTGRPVPYVPVRLGISVRGLDRFYTVMTDADGVFRYTFTPGTNEAGVYSIWAVHPDIKDRSIQSSFSIAGFGIDKTWAAVQLPRGGAADIPLALINYGGGSLTGLKFSIQASPGITAELINNGDDILTPGERASVALRITTAEDAPDNGFASLSASVDQGLQVNFNSSVSIVTYIPKITTSPSLIDTGLMRGQQKIASFTLRNAGQETLKNARLEGLFTDWMALTGTREIGDLKPGESRVIGIMMAPPDTTAPGVYDDKLVIYSDNHIPYQFFIQVTVTSSAIGSVVFDLLNELYEDVAGASIRVQSQLLPELIYTLKTVADGTAALFDIPEGRYSYSVSATGHKPYSGSFEVYPGITTAVPIALEVALVEVEFSVTPVLIEDRYQIVVRQTFQTNVPTSVLVVDPPAMTVPDIKPGEVFNGEFTISNQGRIAVSFKGLSFPANWNDYELEVLSLMPPSLDAMQRISVPYRIKRRAQ